MLKVLRIRNYALIDDAEIPFKDGFTTITGETGAGKSIMLGALALLLGSRADSSVLKDDSVKSVVEAQFSIAPYCLKEFFKENDVDYDDETIIRREITPAGKSRSFVNDTPVNLQFLKDLGQQLIEIHSQNSNLAMHDPAFQLEVIDLLAGNQSVLAQYTQLFARYRKKVKELDDLVASSDSLKREAEFKQFLFEELKRAAFKAGEQDEAEQEFAMLTHVEELRTAVQQSVEAISEDEIGCLSRLSQVSKSLADAGKYNTTISQLAERMHSASVELADISTELSRLVPGFESDPERAEILRSRLDLMYHLQQKHKVNTLDALMQIFASLEADLERTNNLDVLIEDAKKAIISDAEQLTAIADNLRSKRKEIAPQIEKNIVSLLRNLGMLNADIKIAFESMPEFGRTGSDTVQFLFSGNKNAPLKPINETASGGEISRIMLCLKSVLSKSKQLPTIVFDEIDVGVSGDIAEKMGLIMKDMSRDMQVIAITHLPQIASKGTHHFAVFKTDSDVSTSTQIVLLDEEKRIEEVAKMLSGKELTAAALENAKSLIRS